MSKAMIRPAVVASIMTAAFGFTGSAVAQTTLTVNDDGQGSGPPGATCDAPQHSTIQAAVAAAVAGDTILVCAGTYAANVVINKDNLTLQGAQAGADARVGRTDLAAESVISGGAGSAVTVAGPSGVTIDGSHSPRATSPRYPCVAAPVIRS